MSPDTNLSSLDHVAIRVEDLDYYVRFFERVFKMEVSALEGDPERPSQHDPAMIDSYLATSPPPS